MEEKMFLENEKGLTFIAQFSKDRKIYKKVCSNNFEYCMNFSENKPVSEKDYKSGNYIIEVIKNRNTFAFSGGVA